MQYRLPCPDRACAGPGHRTLNADGYRGPRQNLMMVFSDSAPPPALACHSRLSVGSCEACIEGRPGLPPGHWGKRPLGQPGPPV